MSIFQELVPTIWRANWAPSSIRKHLFGKEDVDIASLCEMIMQSDGEYSSMLVADRLLDAFEQLDQDGQVTFFSLLNDQYDIDLDALREALDNYAAGANASSLRRLTAESEPARQELFRRLNLAPGGTRRLVKMRQCLLELTGEHPELARMDIDFRHLFNSWFNRGFLVMRPVDWTTPAHILDKIIAYEAVHEIGSWRELRNRLAPEDRYCYAFFHPVMEDEPLVFVEVALTNDIPKRINDILNPDRQEIEPDSASCAIFYSISNCHKGLTGVSFGNFLIKQVATSLQQRFPSLKKFSTISPIPGLRQWLAAEAESDSVVAELIDNIRETIEDTENTTEARQLPGLAARYLLEPKNHRNQPIDPVARFHLKNGARLERLNLFADMSEKGLEQSCGMMVNYVYDLTKVEENHENYMKEHQIVCSVPVRKLYETATKS